MDSASRLLRDFISRMAVAMTYCGGRSPVLSCRDPVPGGGGARRWRHAWPRFTSPRNTPPILLITWRGVATPAEYDAYIDVMTGVLDTKRRYIYVIDATEAALLPEWQRKKQVELIRDNKDRLKLYALGFAFISPSAVFRFMLSSIFIAQPMPVPYVVSPTLREGFAWVRSQLREAGLAVPIASTKIIDSQINDASTKRSARAG